MHIISIDIVAGHESRISAGATENYLSELQGNLMQKSYLLGPTTWKVTQRNAWKDFANLRILRIFGSHTFVPESWMCKKQTTVSHSSKEAEINSLDAGLRMDGIPALTLLDLVIEVFHSVPNRTGEPKRELRRNPSAIAKSNMHNPIPIKHTNVIPTNIDHIPSNTKNSDPCAMLHVFEDNEAVIDEMIIKGPSPTVRHVSRTHRDALDWLFDRINLDPHIQIRYTDTTRKHVDQKEISHVMRGTIFFIC